MPPPGGETSLRKEWTELREEWTALRAVVRENAALERIRAQNTRALLDAACGALLDISVVLHEPTWEPESARLRKRLLAITTKHAETSRRLHRERYQAVCEATTDPELRAAMETMLAELEGDGDDELR